MRSELINEIFSVEDRAEEILQKARVRAESLRTEMQVTKAEEYKKAEEKAKQDRLFTLEQEQKASSLRLSTLENQLMQKRDQLNSSSHAESIADAMVSMLSSCKLQD